MRILEIALILNLIHLCNCLGQNLSQDSNKALLKPYGDVSYFLCRRNKTFHPINLNLNLNDLNIDLPVKLIIHGFTENITVLWYKAIVDAYLIKNDYNLILVDWSIKANLPYFDAVESSSSVGSSIGDFLIKLITTKKIYLDNVHIIGHSLGSHVAGFVGKRIFKITKSKVSRITGLDPAGPLFEIPSKSPEYRLSKEDAKFVDIIHTDGGIFGFKASIGHADFFPNGGTAIQSGCEITKLEDFKKWTKQIRYSIHFISVKAIKEYSIQIYSE
ncbi:hypothetical protein ILUMI_05532 [Ignelater luminosus]|uniref:Lipase domain-containing protein n=1 Tax=Ignelater luminosus TaxID=2038154 RepID=A0A8K0D741_IGNLU|nr:hypothetical protein ILUMI_05532 [Ignelater luminosus]